MLLHKITKYSGRGRDTLATDKVTRLTLSWWRFLSYYVPISITQTWSIFFRLCIYDDSGSKKCRWYILVGGRLSAILNSRWRSFLIQAKVKPKVYFNKYGQIVHCWKETVMLISFNIEKGGLKWINHKVSYI